MCRVFDLSGNRLTGLPSYLARVTSLTYVPEIARGEGGCISYLLPHCLPSRCRGIGRSYFVVRVGVVSLMRWCSPGNLQVCLAIDRLQVAGLELHEAGRHVSKRADGAVWVARPAAARQPIVRNAPILAVDVNSTDVRVLGHGCLFRGRGADGREVVRPKCLTAKTSTNDTRSYANLCGVNRERE